MNPSEVIVEWFQEGWYYDDNNVKKHAGEIMGTRRLYDKSPQYIAGYCQCKADQGYGVSIEDFNGTKVVHGLLKC